MDVEALGTALQRESDVEGGEEGNFARMLARKTAEQRKKKKKAGEQPPLHSPLPPSLCLSPAFIHSEPHCLCREMLERLERLSRGSHNLGVPQSARQAQGDLLFFGDIPNATAGGIWHLLQLAVGLRPHFFTFPDSRTTGVGSPPNPGRLGCSSPG